VKLASYRVFGAVLTASLLVCSGSARAQGHGGGFGGHVGAAPALHMAPHSAVAPRIVSSAPRVGVAPRPGTTLSHARVVNGVIHVTRRRTPNNTNVPPGLFAPGVEDTSGFSFDNVPGLGFDFPHLAAIHPNSRGRHNRDNIGSFIPFFDGGFFFPSSPVVVDDETEDAQQADAGPSEPARTARHMRAQREEPVQSAEDSAQEQASAEQPLDNTQYVFVRRDGSVFFAVAYSWDNGKLRYITNQGARGTVERDSLDIEATRRFNEERGLSFALPA
jgi:hypothetical protein